MLKVMLSRRCRAALCSLASGAASAAQEIYLRAGAEEHQQSVLRPGARRLQEGGEGAERRGRSASTSAPANTAAATRRRRSSPISSPRRSTASPFRRPTRRRWPTRLQGAAAAKIPVLTWDSDLLPKDKGDAPRLCRHAQLRDRRQPRQARACRSSRRAARSASSPAAPRRPTTTSACRAFATRSPARRARNRRATR